MLRRSWFTLFAVLTACAGETRSAAVSAPPILIEDAFVLDGTGAEGAVLDVRLRDGRIEAVGNLSASDGEEVINAAGLVLAPALRVVSHCNGARRSSVIRLYGNPVSRAHRVMRMLEELGLDYELKDGHEGPRGSTPCPPMSRASRPTR